MGSRPGPDLGFPRSFDRVADVFAIPERRFTEEFAIFSANLEAVESSVLGLAQKSLLKGQCSFQNLLQTINDLLAKPPGEAGA